MRITIVREYNGYDYILSAKTKAKKLPYDRAVQNILIEKLMNIVEATSHLFKIINCQIFS